MEYEGWNGTYDDPEKKVGIAASILVREQWIEFRNPRIRKGGRLRRALSNIFASQTSRKAQQFEVLLAFLVRKALQDPCERKYATLACHAFVLEVEKDQPSVIQQPGELEKVIVHPNLIEQFAKLPPGTHEEFVKSVIEADAPTDQAFDSIGYPTTANLGAPMASAYDVITALEELQIKATEDPQKIPEEISNIPRNVRRDLSSLGFLLATRGRTVDRFADFQGTAHSALLFAASNKEWFNYTASLLESRGLRFAAYQVGLEVSEEFGLGWGEASQRRYGHNMKRWVSILHPKFADLRKDHVDYWYVRALKAHSDTKGSIPIIDSELAEEIEFRRLSGLTYKVIAQEVGISTGSYANWKSKNPEAAKAAIEAAKRRRLFGS